MATFGESIGFPVAAFEIERMVCGRLPGFPHLRSLRQDRYHPFAVPSSRVLPPGESRSVPILGNAEERTSCVLQLGQHQRIV